MEGIPRILERRAASEVLSRHKAEQVVEERAVLEDVRHGAPGLLSVGGIRAIRSRFAVDTPRASAPDLRRRNVRLLETMATRARSDCPPPWRAVLRLLEDLFRRLRRLLDAEVCPLLVAAAAHHGVVVVHPFLDGNGRTARVLGSAIASLCPETCRVDLSWHFGERPAAYYAVVPRTLHSTGAFTGWLAFVLGLATCGEGSGSVACIGPAGCAHRFAVGELTECYAGFLRDVGAVEQPLWPATRSLESGPQGSHGPLSRDLWTPTMTSSTAPRRGGFE